MQFTIDREDLLQPLQLIIGAVEKKQAMSILGNALVKVRDSQLTLIATDLQVELHGHVQLQGEVVDGIVTVPARKLLDITRAFQEKSKIEIVLQGDILHVKSGTGVFKFKTLSADDFPNSEEGVSHCEFSIDSHLFRSLIEKVSFSIAQQDVRYYLNGLLLEKKGDELRTVTTDGHRLSTAFLTQKLAEGDAKVIIPRRGALELMRILNQVEGIISVTIGDNHIRVAGEGLTFTSRLIEGVFPDYRRVIPNNLTKQILIGHDDFKQMLSRAAILSNEKFHGLYLHLQPGKLIVETSNSEQEEAKEEIEVDYSGAEMEGAYNVVYLLDAINALPSGTIKLSFAEGNSSALIEHAENASSLYVIMPMRL